MLQSNAPAKLVLPFAESGAKNAIPTNSQVGITPGAASLVDGFPPLTRTPLVAGGVPPSGLDFNGIFNVLSAIDRWSVAGGRYYYDNAFAVNANVNGYPKGAVVLRSDAEGGWLNLIDNNVNNPDTGGAGWVPEFQYGVTAITMTNANVTLTALQAGRPIIIITGLLTANLSLNLPNYLKTWSVINNTTGAFTITVKTVAGTGVLVTQGSASELYCDGVNIGTVAAAPTLPPDATVTVKGIVELATDAETVAGTDAVRATTPASVQAKITDQLATTTPAALGTAAVGNGTKYARDNHVHALPPDATVTVKGIVELATDAETVAGTDAVRATTPASVQAKITDQLATTTPAALGTAAVGNGTKYARDNHVHAMPAFGGLTDVTFSAPASGETITFNGTVWINRTLAAAGIASRTLTITAGNGLAGGGDLTANRTLTLGTPDSLTASTANAVTATSHTHAVAVASETVQGLVELATNAETVAGTDAVRAVTPSNLSARIATETITGIVEKATTAEAQAFTTEKYIDGALLNLASKGPNQSLAATGFQRFPGGLIMQWGITAAIAGGGATSGTTTFPVAFPTACDQVIFSSNNAPNSVSTPSWTDSITASNFSIRNQHGLACTFRWVAFGR